MLLLLVGFSLYGAVFTGIGWLVRRLLPPGTHGTEEASHLGAFWVGWAASLLFLLGWHFIAPVDGWATGVLVIVSVAGWIAQRRALAQRLRDLSQRPELVIWTIAAALLVARAALGPVGNGDSGVYHLPAVEWAKREPIVFGLANLNPLLGLDSSYFLYFAALDSGPFLGRVHHLAPGLLVLALMAQAGVGFSRSARFSGRIQPASFLSALLLPVAIDQLVSHDLVSAAADLAVAVGGAAVAIACAEWMTDETRQERRFLESVLLAAAVSTLKLSYAVTAALALVLCAGLLLLRKMSSRRVLFFGCLTVAMGPLAFILRSGLLTGYLGYPSTFLQLPVSWRIPKIDADDVANFVLAWGRSTGGPSKPLLGTWSWFGPWLEYIFLDNRHFLVPMAIAVIAAASLVAARIRRRQLVGPLAWMLVVPMGSIGFWMVTAPDPRFAGASLWLLPALLATCAAVAWGFARHEVLVLLVVAAIVGLWPLGSFRPRQVRSLWELEPVPAAVTRAVPIASGGSIAVPEGWFCWRQPPPCTFFATEGLRQTRRLGHVSFEISSGARILNGNFVPLYEQARDSLER